MRTGQAGSVLNLTGAAAIADLQHGTIATRSAATPDGTRCSAHTTAPLRRPEPRRGMNDQ